MPKHNLEEISAQVATAVAKAQLAREKALALRLDVAVGQCQPGFGVGADGGVAARLELRAGRHHGAVVARQCLLEDRNKKSQEADPNNVNQKRAAARFFVLAIFFLLFYPTTLEVWLGFIPEQSRFRDFFILRRIFHRLRRFPRFSQSRLPRRRSARRNRSGRRSSPRKSTFRRWPRFSV